MDMDVTTCNGDDKLTLIQSCVDSNIWLGIQPLN